MSNVGLFTVLLVLVNFLMSYRGIKDQSFFQRFLFRVDDILIGKQFHRLISSGFLHVGWWHFAVNMITLIFFSEVLMYKMNSYFYLTLYFLSLLGGNLLALFFHREHGDYSAVGASGAVCGVLFASIALYPGMELTLLFIPANFPAWLFALLYVIYTLYGIRSKSGNVGHEAHLGGLLTGVFFAILYQPSILRDNFITLLLILGPSLSFLYFIIKKPHILLFDSSKKTVKARSYGIDDAYNLEKVEKENELNSLLDKIAEKGMDSLSKTELRRLKELSGE